MKKKSWLLAAVIIGVVLVAIITLPFVIDADQFRPAIQNELNAMLGREMTIGHLDLSVWRGTLKAADISVSDDAAFITYQGGYHDLELGLTRIPSHRWRTFR